MASNGYGNSGSTILVMYRIVNHESDKDDPQFNAFHMPRSAGTTLKAVKENCAALRSMNSLGPDGYHWRVCVEDKPVPGGSGERTYSWWDIQDENARLPVKEAPQSQIAKLFAPPKKYDSSADAAAKAAKGAFKAMGKALAGTDGVQDHGPPVSVVAFKLLDLMKMHDDFNFRNGGRSAPAAAAQPRARAPAPPPARQQQQRQQQRAPARQHTPPAQHQQQRAQPRAQPPRPPPQQQAQQASLLDFGTPAAAPAAANPRTLHHTTSSPAAFTQLNNNKPPPPPANETRAEKLKREYAQKNAKANRVWDDVDQRWVEVAPNAAGARATASAPPGANVAQKKEKGLSLEASMRNAAGKSNNVQAAVQKRVNEVRNSQQKAVQEVKQREEAKKLAEAEEDVVRKKLEPRIKQWSEEHGKKKQLRALLGTMHTILWEGANWKPIGLGDLLDDSKCKRAFHKASRVVHPDKTHHLDAEKRFLAKRIFDALSQAKTQFDEGAK